MKRELLRANGFVQKGSPAVKVPQFRCQFRDNCFHDVVHPALFSHRLLLIKISFKTRRKATHDYRTKKQSLLT